MARSTTNDSNRTARQGQPQVLNGLLDAGCTGKSDPGFRNNMKGKTNHMKQVEIRTIRSAVALSELAIHGATLLEGTLGITRNTAAAMTADKNALQAADNVYELAKTAYANEKAARQTVLDGGRAFVRLTRDLLKPQFGNQHNASWTAAGFQNSIEIPRNALPVGFIAGKLEELFTQTPALENEALNITAAQAGTVATNVIAAENAVNTKKVELAAAKLLRDGAFATLRKRLLDLVKELAQILGPLDPKWEQFGLNRPGAQVTPDVPVNLVVTLMEGNKAVLKWDAAARANHYRAWMKVIGVDADYLPAGSPGDTDVIIENVPGNAQVEFAISAVNTGGESAKSVAVVVTTP